MAMTQTTTRLPFGAITVHRVVSFASELADRYNRWNQNRRTVSALRRLSREQLEDIGLVPADVDAIERRGHL